MDKNIAKIVNNSKFYVCTDENSTTEKYELYMCTDFGFYIKVMDLNEDNPLITTLKTCEKYHSLKKKEEAKEMEEILEGVENSEWR